MGHLLGGEKLIFLIRAARRYNGHGGRAGLILSIRGPEVSLGSPGVGTIHVHAPTPHTLPLQAFLADFSPQTTRFGHLLAIDGRGAGRGAAEFRRAGELLAFHEDGRTILRDNPKRGTDR